MKMLVRACLMCLALSSCATQKLNSVVDVDRTEPMQLAPRPDFPGYGSAVGKQSIEWTPQTLANDFAELLFETEWGAKRDTLLRWDGPVTIALADAELDAYRPEVDSFVATIRTMLPEFDLSVSSTRSGTITVRTAPFDEISDLDANVLCFFVPVDKDLKGYIAATDRGEGRWEDVQMLEKVTIFIPQFASPRVFRSCIIEEIAQALGPSNDLYRLEDSSYNDDAAHDFLTAFDLLMLRVLYAPEMRAGMSRSEATAAAAQVIRRFGPGNSGPRTRAAQRRDRVYDKAIQKYNSATDDIAERQAINYVLRVTSNMDRNDHRRGAALRMSAHLHRVAGDYDLAVSEMREVVELFERTLPADSARLARARSDLGFVLIDAEEYDDAARYLESSEAGLAANSIDDELAYTLFQRAIALRLAGRAPEARRVEKQALAWAAYVFGADGKTLSRWQKTFKDFEKSS